MSLRIYCVLVAAVLLCSGTSCQDIQTDCYCVEPHVHSYSEFNCDNPCKNDCHPLSYYINISIINGSTFYFLPGTHNLKEVFNFNFINNMYYNLSLVGIACNGSHYCARSRPAATVVCNGTQTGFYFRNIYQLTITGISFNDCGFIDNVGYKVSALLIMYTWNMHVCGVEIHRSKGWGLYCYSVFGESYIINTTISEGHHTQNHTGGNLRLKYYNHGEPHWTQWHNISVKDTLIINGRGNIADRTTYAGGINIYFTTMYRINLLFYNVTMMNNSGHDGGNIAISYTTLTNGWNSRINITSCKISYGQANTGAGLYIRMIMKPQYLVDEENALGFIALSIVKTAFFNNKATYVGGGGYLQLHENKVLSETAQIIFRECIFINNSHSEGHGGCGMHVINFQLPGFIPHHLPQYRPYFETCSFNRNGVIRSHNSASCGTLYIEDNALTVIKDSNFSDNSCSGIGAVRSALQLEGIITIANNTANNGGGMVLCASSVIYLSQDVQVFIENNTAHKYGGGIYAEFQCSEAFPVCFYQVNNTGNIISDNNTVHLVHNVAQAGDAVYGGSIDSCFFFAYEAKHEKQPSEEIFDKLFKITPTHNTSVIASSPYKVCFCDSQLPSKCDERLAYPHPVYPGDTIDVPAVLVGQRNGAALGVVVAQLQLRYGVTHRLGLLQSSQIINSSRNCTTLKYTIFTNITELDNSGAAENILLSVNNADFREVSEAEFIPSSINVSISPCPYGFEIRNGRCDCLEYLTRNLQNVTCDISNVTIRREGSVMWWLGFDIEDDNLIFSLFCPFDFCISESTDINLTNSSEKYDIQCAFNRTGYTCGKCKPGLSVVFGSSNCKHCKSTLNIVWLTLLFGIIGIVFILLLGFLNLNVTEGALNPIIFYMNILRMNSSLFFHSPKLLSNPQYHISGLLNVFVAWMNLDLGIESCYFHGMGAIGKVALQFVFPLYLWILTGLIIYFSRRYSLIARMAGKGSVKLLATVILFSYAKIVRCIIDALWPSTLHYVTNSTHLLVWKMDGSKRYFHKEHALLFILAIFMACCTLPYTLSLLFIQCLRKGSHMKLLFWVARLKPFFDAYTGPYRDKYHFWTGFLLIVRIILFLAIAANIARGPILNISLINVTASILLLLNIFRLYKTWQLTAIEAFTYLNLIVLSIGTAYVRIERNSNFNVVLLCVGSMFLLLCGVVVYNVYKKISKTNSWGEMNVWLLEQERPWMTRKPVRSLILPHALAQSSSSDDERDPIIQNVPAVAKYDDYREPLIDFTDDC